MVASDTAAIRTIPVSIAFLGRLEFRLPKSVFLSAGERTFGFAHSSLLGGLEKHLKRIAFFHKTSSSLTAAKNFTKN
jgi:hypothetical protein